MAVQSEFTAHLHGVNLHPPQMIAGGAIFGLNGQRERLNGSKVNGRHLLGVLLAILHACQVQRVRSVKQVRQR